MPSQALRFECLAVEHYGLLERFYRQQRSAMRIKAANQVWVARDSEICAGLCLHQLEHGQWLTGLCVAQNLRGKGIASALVTHSLAKQHQSTWLFCQAELIRLYQPLGFKLCSDLPQPLQQRLVRYQRRQPQLIALTKPAD